MLCEGVGGERDPEGGMRHYERAAEQGDTMALFNLGLVHADGEHGQTDLARAIGYFRRGHEAGHDKATLQLGIALREHGAALAEQGHADTEVKALHAEALYALQKLAEDGTKRQQGWACYELGWMRFRGQGGPHDAAASERWLLTGAALDDCEENRESQGPCMRALVELFYGDPDSPRFDEDKAREWTQRVAALAAAAAPDQPA
ncbi:MAG: tetratricopeptide repeat protein, partial [Variovorax sp.]|nr:tetratricopeptide repeat protein [Variovorax sp.]